MKTQLGLIKYLLFSGLIIGFTGLCSSVVAQNNNSNSEPLAEVAIRVTGQLQTRNYLITIYAGRNGPLYTVIDGDGNVKGVQMPPKLLAQEFPILKSIIENPADDASNNNFHLMRRNGGNISIGSGYKGLGTEL
jgi:hypothetical protein